MGIAGIVEGDREAAEAGKGLVTRFPGAEESGFAGHFGEILRTIVEQGIHGEAPGVELILEYGKQLDGGREAKAEEIESLAERLGREIRELERGEAE